MPTRIAINGFGRIGRAAFKIALEKPDVEIVAINDLTDIPTLAHLLRYDTAYGKYEKEVSVEGEYLVVDGKKSKIISEKEPNMLPWKEMNIDVVLECTGRFVKDGASRAHIEAGARRVVVSAPTKGVDDIQTFLKGVNDNNYFSQDVISNASCTTNCISPVISVIHSNLGIKKAAMTTIHAMTSTQKLVDSPDKDLRRGRAAPFNMIPTSTGAAIATTRVIPDLDGKFDGLSVRVPVITGSLSDITMLVEKNTSVEEVNKLFLEAKEHPLYKGVLDATNEPIVSSDIIKSSFSAIVDLEMTRVVDGDLVKVLAWYDNEWGYSNRLVEMALLISS